VVVSFRRLHPTNGRRMSEPTIYDLVTQAIRSAGFVKAVLSVPIDRSAARWQKVTIRTVELQRGPVLQIVRFDDRQADTKSVSADDPLVDETCRLAFRHAVVQTTESLTEARVTKKGKVLSTTTAVVAVASSAHDRAKARLVDESAPFLEVLGLASAGSVKPTGQKKFRQINEFVRAVLGTTGFDDVLRESPVRVVDFGCGNAYLTFAIYHYLHVVLGQACEVVGVDRNGPLMQRANERAAQLGWTGLTFREGDIETADLDIVPHVVIALHACDTATDDVLSRAVGWQAGLVLVSPCCHHDVQRQLRAATSPSDYASMVRRGLLKERLGDVLTDSLRCDLLGLVGYQSDVIEFISLEHTAKNLMIRAHRTGRVPAEEQIDGYRALRDQWNIEPYLERKLSSQLPIALARQPAE
jgi:SAM-dependent methyltransferase